MIGLATLCQPLWRLLADPRESAPQRMQNAIQYEEELAAWNAKESEAFASRIMNWRQRPDPQSASKQLEGSRPSQGVQIEDVSDLVSNPSSA